MIFNHFDDSDDIRLLKRFAKAWTRPELRFFSGGAGSSSGTTTPQATPEQLIQMYNQYLPQTLNTAASSLGGVNQGLAQSAAVANPIYTQSGLDQLNSYAPGYQAAGANIAQQQATSQLNLLNGTGGQVAAADTAISNANNPVQATAQNQTNNLLNSYNLNGLSGGEQAATERSLNQSNYATGNLGIDNATNAVSNAMNFGNAFNAKRAALNTALGTAQGTAANQNTFANPVTNANNAGNTSSNFGLSTFAPTQANSNITSPLSFASSFGNQLAGVASASRGTTSSGSANGGCYLTTACCTWKGLPDDCEQLMTLRSFRDTFVPRLLIDEYYKIAPTIVRRIEKNEEKLKFVFEEVEKCVKMLRSGLYGATLAKYEQMTKEIQ